MMIRNRISPLLHLAAAVLLLTSSQARTWTSADGSKTFEAEFESYDEVTGTFTVIMGGGKKEFKQEILSAADTAFLKANLPTRTNAIPDELPDPDGEEAVMGEAFDEPVMLLKSCIGNRSLGWDLLPPGSERLESH